MTDDQIALVQSSFAEVAPISEQAAALFYSRLFEIAPEVKPMFSGDMVAQGHKLMKTLNVAVNGLNDLDDHDRGGGGGCSSHSRRSLGSPRPVPRICAATPQSPVALRCRTR